MANLISTLSLDKMRLKFITEPAPMLSMLEWLCDKLMEAEVESTINAAKSERTVGRKGYRSG